VNESLLKSLLDNVFGIFTNPREAQRDREYLRLYRSNRVSNTLAFPRFAATTSA